MSGSRVLVLSTLRFTWPCVKTPWTSFVWLGESELLWGYSSFAIPTVSEASGGSFLWISYAEEVRLRVSTVATQCLPCSWKPFLWLPSDLLSIDLGLRSYELLQCWLGWVRNGSCPVSSVSQHWTANSRGRTVEATGEGLFGLFAGFLVTGGYMYSFCLLWCYLVSHQKRMWPCVLGAPQQASVPSARLPSVPCPCLANGGGEWYSLVVSVSSTPAWDQWQVQFKVCVDPSWSAGTMRHLSCLVVKRVMAILIYFLMELVF